ncbi:hypothetical protein GUJ93_ZPchr0012g20931 [Zizania palustris]|uniref:F-box domain-containing protein n=1 Tax=Zizania palustris TaxID=103762 RepID=A0A8J5WPC6_ZIZPA|nr:hypothetical protein GUJ93_ZPchr0012g20931 [Zizania palustris]
MEAEESASSVLHGDLLECVLLRVQPDELIASPTLVSWEWRRAARAVQQRRCRGRGHRASLVTHVQGAYTGCSTHVYDPRRRAWGSDGARVMGALLVQRCCCAGGDRVYALSLASMTISADALDAAWCELPPPRVWRVDPVVAVVGPRVVVLGGGCGATETAGVVEVLDEAGWTQSAPMPAPLASRWVSAVTSERRVYVVESGRQPGGKAMRTGAPAPAARRPYRRVMGALRGNEERRRHRRAVPRAGRRSTRRRRWYQCRRALGHGRDHVAAGRRGQRGQSSSRG